MRVGMRGETAALQDCCRLHHDPAATFVLDALVKRAELSCLNWFA